MSTQLKFSVCQGGTVTVMNDYFIIFLLVHQLCYRNIHELIRDLETFIHISGPCFIVEDECEFPPLHIVSSYPYLNVVIINHLYNKHREAAVVVSTKNMTPSKWYDCMI